MDSQKKEEGRPTLIDYPQFEEYGEEDFNPRFSLHSANDMSKFFTNFIINIDNLGFNNNQMVGESPEMVNANMNQEDNGYYYRRQSEIPGNNMNEFQIDNNYVQNYQLREKNSNQQILENQITGLNTISGKG